MRTCSSLPAATISGVRISSVATTVMTLSVISVLRFLMPSGMVLQRAPMSSLLSSSPEVIVIPATASSSAPVTSRSNLFCWVTPCLPYLLNRAVRMSGA